MEEAQPRAELTTFSCKECYVYKPPPASSIGHRAEFWDVDHWLQVCLMTAAETVASFARNKESLAGSFAQDRYS